MSFSILQSKALSSQCCSYNKALKSLISFAGTACRRPLA
ncbi:MAG: hypothetical protein ACI9EB_000998 [Pseudomonas sp.]